MFGGHRHSLMAVPGHGYGTTPLPQHTRNHMLIDCVVLRDQNIPAAAFFEDVSPAGCLLLGGFRAGENSRDRLFKLAFRARFHQGRDNAEAGQVYVFRVTVGRAEKDNDWRRRLEARLDLRRQRIAGAVGEVRIRQDKGTRIVAVGGALEVLERMDGIRNRVETETERAQTFLHQLLAMAIGKHS